MMPEMPTPEHGPRAGSGEAASQSAGCPMSRQFEIVIATHSYYHLGEVPVGANSPADAPNP